MKQPMHTFAIDVNISALCQLFNKIITEVSFVEIFLLVILIVSDFMLPVAHL